MRIPDPNRSNAAMFRFSWSLLSRRRKRQLVWLQLVSLLMAVSTLGGIAAIIPFFSVLADPQAVDRHAVLGWLYETLGFAERGTFLLFLGVGFVVVVMVSNAVNLFGSMALNRFALVLGRDFHVALYEEYLHRDYPFHLRCDSATLTNNVINETARLVSGLVQGGLSLVVNVLAAAFIVASIVLLNPVLALATATLFGGSYALVYFALRQRLARRGQLEAELWDARSRTLIESFGAIKEVLLRGAQGRFRDAFARQSDSIARVSSSIWAMAQAPRYLLESVATIGLVGAAFWLNHGTTTAEWLAKLSFLGFAAYRLLPAIQQAFVAIARIRAHRAAFQRIAEDLRLAFAAEREPPPAESELAPWRGRPLRSITLRDVTFRYGREEPPAISRLSAEILRGQVVGIVGANGAGKTTLADLVLGLLRPQSGSIEVDGITLDERNLRLWRANVGYVPQQIFLLDATVLENIVLGSPDEQVDMARVQAATRAASLDIWLESVPGGLGYRVGERGVRLSGGQRQRIGIARALYHCASVLILDEATSALDSTSETELVAALDSLRGQTTVLVIAHRRSTLRACDVILELEHGRLVGAGKNAELALDSAQLRRHAGGAP
ncbi:MAG TPA: ABC transporter ATP-binding protein [Steroidobacteraceae bacterium]|nr:ABC transporter ATP-binding protein [Steroidobacteraceae bacterium]